jgi:hypothetical protein
VSDLWNDRLSADAAEKLDNTFADISYGYAITSHKSQGSTYDMVAVDTGNIESVDDKKVSPKTKARSIYTALTRAKNVTIVRTGFDISKGQTKSEYTGTPFVDLNREINSAKDSSISHSIDVGDTLPKIPKSSRLTHLVRQMDLPFIQLVYTDELENESDFTRNANGFVKDGVIYINMDKVNTDATIIHELGHLYLGALKSKIAKDGNHPEEVRQYYDILNELKS